MHGWCVWLVGLSGKAGVLHASPFLYIMMGISWHFMTKAQSTADTNNSAPGCLTVSLRQPKSMWHTSGAGRTVQLGLRSFNSEP
jgi:hypothetical protein